MPHLLAPHAIEAFCESAPGWSLLDGRLLASFTMASFAAAIDLVCSVAFAAEEADHHPDIDIRWRTVTFRLSTHSAGGITELDVALAQQISAMAALARSGDSSGG